MAVKNKENRTIVLPIEEEKYELFINDIKVGHEIIKAIYEEYAEFFPLEMSSGYMFNGKTRISKKLGIQMRKIKIGNISYRIRPSFVLSYGRLATENVAHGLFLKRFGVPFWALATVFGHDAMWWYRLYISFGQQNVVSTSVYNLEKLPTDLLADEHHIKIRGKKAYVATTVGKDCFLGMEVCGSANEASLKEAYGVFKEEALGLSPNYQPNSVNTDGWWATQNAWKKLFPSIAVIECFLHAFLKVRDRATKKMNDYFNIAADKIWNFYRTESKRQLAQQIRRLREWTIKNVTNCPMKDNILKLCKKKKKWSKHFDFQTAHKTSNMIDRKMRAMNRHAYNSQMFHADIISTTKNFRAFALLHNFSPSCIQAWDETCTLTSPAARLNNYIYHDNWLQNLLIATSVGNLRSHRNPL
jgi:hypothetical protein